MSKFNKFSVDKKLHWILHTVQCIVSAIEYKQHDYKFNEISKNNCKFFAFNLCLIEQMAITVYHRPLLIEVFQSVLAEFIWLKIKKKNSLKNLLETKKEAQNICIRQI